MDGHFRAFTFVDRITSVQPRVRIEGGYAVPAALDSFPQALAVEAVGQLAAWAAMAAVDFKVRPVAGIAGKVDLISTVQPGQTLDLVAHIETAEEDAVAYGGHASVAGVPVVSLEHCVGPMMPVEEFDDSVAIRDQFVRLCGPGATPGGFGGMPQLALNYTGGETGERLLATLDVPATGDFFADHFPRKPVFPGTLFMHLILQMAELLAAQIPAPAAGGVWKARSVTDAKLRAFIPPGDRLDFEAKVDEVNEDSILIAVVGRKNKRVVGGNNVRFTAGKPS